MWMRDMTRALALPDEARRVRTDDRLAFGVIGLGRIGAHHAENLAGRVPNAFLAAVMDADADVAESVGRRLGVAWTTDADALAGAASIDAVVIASPAGTHADLIGRATAAGKHVFCEKPLALELAEAERAVEAARSAGATLQVGFQLRADRDFAALWPNVRAGGLGEIHFFHARLRDMEPPAPDYLRASGGLFVDGAIHLLDLARWLVGDIVEVSAFGSSVSDPAFAALGDADHVVTVVRFGNGALGVLENSRACGYGFDCEVEIVGSRRSVRVASHRRTNQEWREPGTVRLDHVRDFLERFADAYRAELEAFAAAIAGERAPLAGAEDALAATRLALAAREACRSGRPVRLPSRPPC
jgi:predicted dehydrogenase